MSIGAHSEARKTGQLLDIEISAGLTRLRTRLSGAAGADALINRLDMLDERRAELLRRLDGMPDVGGGAGLPPRASSTSARSRTSARDGSSDTRSTPA
jgi:hypothetical protein